MRTFVFFIGGTGARVLRSLTMLMASGVSLKDGDSIVPIMVDYDATNADLKRTNELLSSYQHFHKVCDYENDSFDGGFFRTPLGVREGGDFQQLDSLVTMTFDGAKSTFGGYIGYDSLSSPQVKCETTKLLIDSLYDNSSSGNRDRELNLELNYGFKGNPNIGSVVFNKYFKTDQYQDFKDNFNSGDRIFIVASIFGGTGSSGLPQIVKKVRETAMDQISHNAGGSVKAIREAMLGACVVLPYFKVKEKQESAINSHTFNSKAKAALNYYHDEINGEMSEVYYIGCTKYTGTYDNQEGGELQKNRAHLVELLAAMSIVEFANHPEMRPGDATRFYEYASTSVTGDLPSPSFQDLLCRVSTDIHVYKDYVKKMNAFALLVKFFRDITRKEEDKVRLARNSYYKNWEVFLRKGTDFSEKFNEFAEYFIQWVEELRDNPVLQFVPYNFDARNLDELIRKDDSNVFKKLKFENIITPILNAGSSIENDRGNSKGSKAYLRYAFNGCMEAVSKIS